MLSFLFWNLNRSENLLNLLADAVAHNRINLLVLAESAYVASDVCAVLSNATEVNYQSHSGILNKRIQLFSAEGTEAKPPIIESSYLTVHPIQFERRFEFLMGAFHNISLLEASALDVNEEASSAAQLVRDAEAEVGHSRTVVMGDFNLNPFDEGLAKARGFHAVMSRADALRERRRMKGNDYPLFYNPMWSRLGDASPGPPGTFYRDKTSHLTYYWHTFDQVLVRPSLLGVFRPQNVSVLERIGDVRLLKDGKPDGDGVSDHLPVMLRLDL